MCTAMQASAADPSPGLMLHGASSSACTLLPLLPGYAAGARCVCRFRRRRRLLSSRAPEKKIKFTCDAPGAPSWPQLRKPGSLRQRWAAQPPGLQASSRALPPPAHLNDELSGGCTVRCDAENIRCWTQHSTAYIAGGGTPKKTPATMWKCSVDRKAHSRHSEDTMPQAYSTAIRTCCRFLMQSCATGSGSCFCSRARSSAAAAGYRQLRQLCWRRPPARPVRLQRCAAQAAYPRDLRWT